MATKLGVMMKMPSIMTRTRLAHEAAAWARSLSKGEAMNDAIFRAWFERGLDIGNLNILMNLATSIGLNPEDLRQSLTSHSHLPEVLDDEEQAQKYGLTGVPAFIWNGHGLVGVQTVSSLEGLLAK